MHFDPSDPANWSLRTPTILDPYSRMFPNFPVPITFQCMLTSYAHISARGNRKLRGGYIKVGDTIQMTFDLNHECFDPGQGIMLRETWTCTHPLGIYDLTARLGVIGTEISRCFDCGRSPDELIGRVFEQTLYPLYYQ